MKDINVNLIKDKSVARLMRLRNQSLRSSSILVVKRLIRARLHQTSASTLRNSLMTLAVLFSLQTMESLQNRLQPYSGVTPLIPVRAVSLVSSQH